jgi:hypothetical protein
MSLLTRVLLAHRSCVTLCFFAVAFRAPSLPHADGRRGRIAKAVHKAPRRANRETGRVVNAANLKAEQATELQSRGINLQLVTRVIWVLCFEVDPTNQSASTALRRGAFVRYAHALYFP